MVALILDIPGTTKAAFHTTLTVDCALLEVEEDVRFVSPGVVEVLVEPVQGGYLLTGTASVGTEVPCSRCLAPVPWSIREPFRMVLSRHPLEDLDDDWALFPVGEHEFDVAPLVRELIIVALPQKPLCRPDCLGLCPVCGADRNVEPCGCAAGMGDPRWAELASWWRSATAQSKEAAHGATEEEDL